MEQNIEPEETESENNEPRDKPFEIIERTNGSLWDVFKDAPRIENDLFERDTSPARDIEF